MKFTKNYAALNKFHRANDSQLTPIRTALIGFGFSGRTFHAPFLKTLPSFKVTHIVSERGEEIYDVFPDRNINIIKKENIDHIFKNPEIDLVIITAPNKEHYELAKTALLHDKHVVVEKPFVLDINHGQELIEIARSKKLILTVYSNRRWDSDFITLQSFLQTRTLGDILFYRARYDRYRPTVNLSRWKEANGIGSGTLWDLGAHLIDQALVLFGLPDSVFCDAIPQRPLAKTVDYFDIQFFYTNGLRVNLSSTSLALSPGPKYEIHGTVGSYKKYGNDPQEQNLIQGISPLTNNFGSENPENYGTISNLDKDQKKVEETVKSKPGMYIDFFIKLADSIRNGSAPPVAAEDALDVVKLIRSCEESHQQKKAIRPAT